MTRAERQAEREAARRRRRGKFTAAVEIYRESRTRVGPGGLPISQGISDAGIARRIGASPKTIQRWKQDRPEWSEAIAAIDAEASRLWNQYLKRLQEQRERKRDLLRRSSRPRVFVWD